MFPDWKNQYCENNHTTQSNLQIECNSYQTTIDIFHRTRTKNFIICMKTQKTMITQNNLEKEWRWGNQLYCPQSILQSYSHQKSMILEQNKNSPSKHMHLSSINIQQKKQNHTMEKRQLLQSDLLGKLGVCVCVYIYIYIYIYNHLYPFIYPCIFRLLPTHSCK